MIEVEISHELYVAEKIWALQSCGSCRFWFCCPVLQWLWSF